MHLNQPPNKNSLEDKKIFSELLQRTFVLKAIGLGNKEVREVLIKLGYSTTNDCIMDHCRRINQFYKGSDGKKSLVNSISQAWRNDDLPRLIEKYRQLFLPHIILFETTINIKFEKLGGSE